MGKLTMKFVGIDHLSRPAYRDQYGRLWKDLNQSEGSPDLYSVTGNDIVGEPMSPLLAEYDFDPEPYRRSEYAFQYMMLYRLRSDCDYYLGWGNRCASRLYDKDPKLQIEHMKALWAAFPEGAKPQWLSWEQILEYERMMVSSGKEDAAIVI